MFRYKRDYRYYLSLLRKLKQKYNFKLYAYILMPNHIHLMTERGKFSLSKIMHELNTAYAIYFNQKYQQSGHLFQDRFQSIIVNKESYFWELSRYIHLNSVRAGLVSRPEDYPWSSYPIYFYNRNDSLVDKMEILNKISGTYTQQIKKYCKFVEEGIYLKKDKIDNLAAIFENRSSILKRPSKS
ncbi:MAG: transposase [Patescibacteria group bacterium]